MLEPLGHECFEAHDGHQGLAQFKEHQPELVISDIVMPNVEGIETISKIKAESPETIILAISGGGKGQNLDYLDFASKLGADQVLAKPFRREALIEVVQQLLK